MGVFATFSAQNELRCQCSSDQGFCEIMKCVANLCSLSLVGCASHRYDLAVIKFFPLLKKPNTMMGKLKSSLKLAGHLTT